VRGTAEEPVPLPPTVAPPLLTAPTPPGRHHHVPVPRPRARGVRTTTTTPMLARWLATVRGWCARDRGVTRAAVRAWTSARRGAERLWATVFDAPGDDAEAISSGVPDDYPARFWYGARYKAKFTLDIIRTIPLFMSIYLAVFTLVHVPRLYALATAGGALRRLGTAVFLVVAYFPAVVVQFKLPQILEDFAVAAHIDVLLNLRYAEQVQSHQRTVAAFHALRVVACLRHPGLVMTIVKQASDPPTPGGPAHRLVRSSAETSDEALLEELVAEESRESRCRRSWAKIFELFDEDHEGSIDSDELRAILVKFADDADESAGHIDEIVAMLDADGSGEVSFDEFYDFGKKLERYMYEARGGADGTASDDDDDDPRRRLAREVFRMIDKDDDGAIDIQELHAVITNVGMEISLHVVYNLVADIDEDGNGALDFREFELLMSRIAFY